MTNSRLAAKRTARIMRSRSSSKRCDGVADSANPALFEVAPALHQINDPIGHRIVNHAVDREVPAPHVLLQAAVAHLARPAAVEVRSVVAKACDLEGLAVDQNENDAELRAHRNGVGENPLNVLGARAGRDIVVLRLFAEQHVAHPAAGEIGLIAFAAKSLHDKNSFLARRHRRAWVGVGFHCR